MYKGLTGWQIAGFATAWLFWACGTKNVKTQDTPPVKPVVVDPGKAPIEEPPPEIAGVPEMVLQGGLRGTADMDLSPDGKFVLTCKGSGASIWELATGQLRHTFTGHTSTVVAVAYSPDGKTVLTSGFDGTAKLWDPYTGKLLRSIDAHDRYVTSVAFAADGKSFVTGSLDFSVKQWNASTGELIHKFKNAGAIVGTVALSPNGALLAAGSRDAATRVWEVSTGKKVHELPAYAATAMSFSPDSSSLLAITAQSSFLFDMEAGKAKHTFAGGRLSAAFAPNGQSVVLGGKQPGIFSTATGKQIHALGSANMWRSIQMGQVMFTADGKKIVSTDAGIKQWNPTSGALEFEIRSDDGFANGISADGSIFFTGDPNQIYMWNTSTGQLQRSFARSADQGSSLSPDTLHSLTKRKDKRTELRNARTGHLRHILGINRFGPGNFADDSTLVVTAGEDGITRLWDVATGQLRQSFTGGSGQARISPNNQVVATTGTPMQLWNAETGELLHTLSDLSDYTFWMKFSPDSRYLVTSRSVGPATVWNVATGQIHAQLWLDWRASRTLVMAAFDSKRGTMATGEDSGLVTLWHLDSGKRLHELKGHKNRIGSLSFSPDGRFLLSGAADNTARVWNAQNGQLIDVLAAQNQSLAFFVPTASQKTVVATQGNNVSFHRLGPAGKADASITFHPLSGDKDSSGRRMTNGLFTTTDGLFAGDERAFNRVAYRIGSDLLRDDLVTADQLFDFFYRPSLVEDFWAGRPLSLHPSVTAGVGRPPHVEILDVPGGVVSSDLVRVRVRAFSRGGGVKELRLFHNGARVGNGEARGLELVSDEPKSSKETVGPGHEQVFEVQLAPGENKLRAEAYSELGMVRSTVATANVTRTGGDSGARPNLHLLVLSIENYTDASMSLGAPHEDAHALVKAFERQKGRLFGDVSVTRLKDANATLEGVSRALGDIAKSARQQDVFIMFAAGHGGMVACDEQQANASYHLLTYRATLRSRRKMCLEAIDMKRLTKLLRAIKSNKKLLVLDTCQSGGAASGDTLLAMRGASEVDAIKRLARSEGLAVLAASKEDQYAFEAKGLGHGLFTYALLQGLQGNAAPRGDDTVSVFSLITYVDRHLPQLARRFTGGDQQANYSTQGTDFPLFSFRPGDAPLIAEQRESTGESRQTILEASAKDIDRYLRSEATMVLDCLGRDSAVVVGNVGGSGRVRFNVHGVDSGSPEGQCLGTALNLVVEAKSGSVRVPLRR